MNRRTTPVATWLACIVAIASMSIASGPLAAQDVPAGLEPPRLVQDVAPVYPADAFDEDVEADVALQADIDDSGTVGAIVPVGLVYYTYAADGAAVEDERAIDDDPYGFVPAAIAAMQQYRFAPATVRADDGSTSAVPVQLTWRIGFVIDVEAEAGDESAAVPDGASREPAVALPPPGLAGEAASGAANGDDENGEGEGEPGEIAAGRDARAVATDGAGPVTLRGRLLGRGTRAPLGALNVMLFAADGDGQPTGDVVATATSALDGTFAFRGVPAGRWTLRVDEVGFERFEVTEEVVEGEVTEVTCYVESNAFGDYVSRTTVSAPRREVTRQVLQVDEIQRIPGNNNDAIRVVQNLPGVARPQFGGGDVIVRGSAPEDTGFYVDGVRVPLIYHFGGLRAVFPTEFIEDISFYPGGFAVDYGRATGGIIDVRTRRDAAERPTGHVDVNLYDAGFYFRTPAGKRLTLELGARRSYIDAVLAGVAGVLPVNFSTAPRYWDYQARISARVTSATTVRLTGIGSDDILDFVLEDEDELAPENRGGIFAHTYFHGGILSVETDMGDGLSNEFRLLATANLFRFTFGEDIYFALTNTTVEARDTLTWEASDAVTLRTGIDMETYPGRIRISAPRPPKEGEEPLDFEATENIAGEESFTPVSPAVFAGIELRPIPELLIVPGLRAEYFEPPGLIGVDPRLAVRGQVSDALVLKGAVSLHHQAPDPEETSLTFGNPDLGLESAIHGVLGAEVALTEALSLTAEAFYKSLDGLVSRSPDTITRGGETVPEIYDNAGE
ncbi:MAG: TonB-dependent receptor, partial [Myxococcales bacterium]|nr:TonB-dependent receptor [Myxococcales bacterium]